MPKGSDPTNVMFRLLNEAQRLDRWAHAHGSPKQREFASGLLKVCLHAINTLIFPAGQTTESTPFAQSRSDAYIIGLRTAEMDRVRQTQSNPPSNMLAKDVTDWQAGYNDYTTTNPAE